jgi:hypothetical protein
MALYPRKQNELLKELSVLTAGNPPFSCNSMAPTLLYIRDATKFYLQCRENKKQWIVDPINNYSEKL